MDMPVDVLAKLLRELIDLRKRNDNDFIKNKQWRDNKPTIAVTKDLMPKEPYLTVIIQGNPNKVRHENWEKVQFPAYCMFTYPFNREQQYFGVLNTAWIDGNMFELHRADKQYVSLSRVEGNRNLPNLMTKYDVEIVRVKIIAKRG